MSYSEFVAEDRRLVILRTLKEAPAHSANCRIVQKLLARTGHRVSLDRVKTDAKWLEEQGLLKTNPFESGRDTDYLVLKMTRRGGEVAEGIVEVPGVAKPSGY